MKKIGFMFGAGAEISYGLPSGGNFALNIFRQNSDSSKEMFRQQRDSIDRNGLYGQWLPLDFETKNITVFGKRAFEDIISSTVEQNRDKIIEKLNNFDEYAKEISLQLKNESNIDISEIFRKINERTVTDTFMNMSITYIKEFNEGNCLFSSNYFSALLMAYKKIKKIKKRESCELGKIIIFILQLQIGALSEKLTRRLNEGLFSKKDEDLDILDDLSDIIQLNYQSVGTAGFEYLLDIQKTDSTENEGKILIFAQNILEKIYADVLDYKSLIDSNWMYLYHPSTEWAKFCKISIFLLNVQNYIKSIYINLPSNRKGYYDDLYSAIIDNKFEVSGIATSNYSPLVNKILKTDKTVFLNGSTELWYDPYLNRIERNSKTNHFMVPLMFTQSGTKPMISIDMSSQYVNYFNELKSADKICVVGFGFNSDDEHINGLFRELVEIHKKKIVIITKKESESEQDEAIKQKFVKRLKLQDDSNVTVLSVDKNRQNQNRSWIDFL